MMTWEEMFVKLGMVGLGYTGIDVAEDGHVIVHLDLFARKDGGGNDYLAERGEFADDVEE